MEAMVNDIIIENNIIKGLVIEGNKNYILNQ